MFVVSACVRVCLCVRVGWWVGGRVCHCARSRTFRSGCPPVRQDESYKSVLTGVRLAGPLVMDDWRFDFISKSNGLSTLLIGGKCEQAVPKCQIDALENSVSFNTLS